MYLSLNLKSIWNWISKLFQTKSENYLSLKVLETVGGLHSCITQRQTDNLNISLVWIIVIVLLRGQYCDNREHEEILTFNTPLSMNMLLVKTLKINWLLGQLEINFTIFADTSLIIRHIPCNYQLHLIEACII